MNFQILPKQFDKISKLRWKIGLGVLGGMAYLTFVPYFFDRPPQTLEQVNDSVNRSKPLQRVDNLCENLPKPKDFHLINKTISGNSRTISISHYYQSNLNREKIESFYLDWFIQNGWELEYQKTLDFRKNNLLIRINEYHSEGFDYVIRCAEES